MKALFTFLKIALALGFSLGVGVVTMMILGSYFNLRPNRRKNKTK